ncbi:Metal transporter CNNM4 [Fasciola gigantica]|uniref:Metal transporter CNNM4 n=1 Tax=Fasciola gigantica TaxID=46835 RepID=A0A504YDD4_FASGI|nr:Metal transporter CNNM4 [Fasciola gigantica]
MKFMLFRVGVIFVLVLCFVGSGSANRLSVLVTSSTMQTEDGFILVKPMCQVNFLGFGKNLQNVTAVSFSSQNADDETDCEDDRVTGYAMVHAGSSRRISFDAEFSKVISSGTKLYICLKEDEVSKWKHAKTEFPKGLLLRYSYVDFPFYVSILLMILTVFLSACFSGLHIGLLKLDKVMLHVVKTAGSAKEKLYATVILPVRENGNRLLCTLLLSNVAVNVVFSIMADKIIGTGIAAVITATFTLLIFAEIMPQSLCTNYGLLIGAKTVFLTQMLLIITAPVSYPLGYLLDKIFGEEIGQVYNREKLKALILAQKSYGCVGEEEVNIITGALSMSTKAAKDIMTPLEQVYMLPYTSVLDFQTTNDIITHGFTRIPIYSGSRSNICTVLNVKDLAFVDPNDKIPVATVCKFYNRTFAEINESTSLFDILRIFKKGSSHIAIVTKLTTVENKEIGKKVSVGVVTLEDVIEEILQEEIIDETDVLVNNEGTDQRRDMGIHTGLYATINRKTTSRLNPQLKLASLRHLTTNIKSFQPQYVHLYVLQSFLNGAIMKEYDYEPEHTENNTLYKTGKTSSTATLILQGHILVELSQENLQFEAGAFMFFGETIFTNINTLVPKLPRSWNLTELLETVGGAMNFVPDYTVTLQSTVQCLEITGEHYLVARYLTECIMREPNPESRSWLGQSNSLREVWEARHATNIGTAVKTSDSAKDHTEYEQSSYNRI